MANQVDSLSLATKSHIIPFYARLVLNSFCFIVLVGGKIVSICTFLLYTTVIKELHILFDGVFHSNSGW